MNNFQKRLYIWCATFCIVIFISELFSEISFLFRPHARPYFEVIHIVFSVAIMITLFILLKKVNNTTLQLQDSNQKLTNIFETLDVAIWSHDLKADQLLITKGIEKLYGYPLERFYEDRELWRKVIYVEDLNVLKDREQKILKGEKVTSLYRILKPDGEIRWIQDRGIPSVNEHGQIVHFTSVLFDMTNKVESENRYRSLVEMSPDFIGVFSNGTLEYVNQAGCQLITGAKDKQLKGLPISKIVSLETINQFHALITEHTEMKHIHFETKLFSFDGRVLDIEATIMPIHYEGKLAYQAVGRDITARKNAEHTIHNMAYYDSLTGLANRNKLREHLTELLNKKEGYFAVLFLDLDRFKVINDTKGHSFGDLLLIHVATRLKKIVQNNGLVSRYSGDEFIIVLDSLHRHEVKAIAQSIIKAFDLPLMINDEEFFITTSIGISLSPNDGLDQETLIKHADTAMYLSKERGKNNFQFYTPNLNEAYLRKIDLETRLRKAMEHRQLTLHYQPQFHLETGKIVGIEALIRWNHPELGTIPPCEFIPLAEETGLIVKLGQWIILKAIQQNKQWQQAGFPLLPIAVNVSVKQLQEEHFIDFIEKALEDTGLNAHYLELEITESIMQDVDQSIERLNALKALGLKIAIDDFGTGYSSLNYLQYLPIDYIKIDKTFIDNIIDKDTCGSIVTSIISMAQSLNFDVIAEGIENEKQVQYLIENQCKVGQGYYYSKPLPSQEIENLLKKQYK
ncbi:diguanylate cyclase (GGDEF)-like protein/PAS domain S-box-containing protein [Pullulanibacillus pueri]|uniref:EAL domain-containing protein n=1 Tax=Pullulanibacillus pueri TaxID=1437324 RepID=A0A8J3EKU9_9BACL|nr:EAL domain-containing protein [Pullulanibacillus pueri]MBM7680832.1 diguanylate cyclase (GGDEF)-like protein/PAS domain S-box-containing protein [Pullulanibacillus pueri]GGH78506.1 hypothetical protein GCM10007096_12040 [Pullulanibacillus pueri]